VFFDETNQREEFRLKRNLRLRDICHHGRPHRFFQRGQRQRFANPCQVADDGMAWFIHAFLLLKSRITRMQQEQIQ